MRMAQEFNQLTSEDNHVTTDKQVYLIIAFLYNTRKEFILALLWAN